MPALFLGVDGGGTKTALCLVTGDGEVVARRRAPSVYYFNDDITLVTRVLQPAVAEICADAGIGPADLTFAFFGLPGYGESSTDRPQLDAAPGPVLGHDRYRCDNDMVCGWAGSLGAVDGINVISGTGSMTYGERAGQKARVGGWGELYGDEGSAFWIAVRGLGAFSRMSDGRLPPGPLLDVVRSQLDLPSDLDLVDVVLNQWASRRDKVASLCPLVVEAADEGDEVAAGILDAAAAELAMLVSCTRDRLGFLPREAVAVSWSGGTFNVERVREGFRTAYLAQHPGDDLRRPLFPPDLGAALYAARLAGRPVAAAALDRLAARTESSPIPVP